MFSWRRYTHWIGHFVLIAGLGWLVLSAWTPAQAKAMAHSSSISDTITIEISPNPPSTGEDSEITVSGIWPNACVPQFKSITIHDYGLLIIHAIAEPANVSCIQVLSPWSFTTTVQFTTPYYYTAYLNVTTESNGTTTQMAWTDFTVSGNISISPTAPRETDEVQLAVSGVHPDGCVPGYLSHQIEDNVITIEAETPSDMYVCGQAVSRWAFTVELVQLALGNYTAEVYITSRRLDSPNRELYKTLAFSVEGMEHTLDHMLFLPFLPNE